MPHFDFLNVMTNLGVTFFLMLERHFNAMNGHEWGEQCGVLHLSEVIASVKFSNEVIHFIGSHCSQKPIVSHDVCLIKWFSMNPIPNRI